MRWMVKVSLIYMFVLIFSAENAEIGHIVFITSPFFGHMIPLLDLAKRLCSFHNVTYVVSQSKINLLKTRGFVDEKTNLKIIGLFDKNDDDYQITDPKTISQIPLILDRMNKPLLKLLFSKFNESSSNLISTERISNEINMIISDLFVLLPIWESFRRNIPSYFFIPNSLKAFVNYVKIAIEKISNGESGLNFDRQMQKTIPLAKGLIFNSIFEFDEQILNEFRQETVPGSNLPILFVAPLLNHENVNEFEMKQWLDAQWEDAKQSPSVIYVSFGSWAGLKSNQVWEIFKALKQYSFVWSLKKEFQKLIPKSSINKTRHVFIEWTPQRFILSHRSIRLFVSHGGWNSLLETMFAGKPVLIWPLFGDQTINGPRLEHEFQMGKCLSNTDFLNEKTILSSQQIEKYFNEIFRKEKFYFQNAQNIRNRMLNAKDNSSKIFLEKLVQSVGLRSNFYAKKHVEF